MRIKKYKYQWMSFSKEETDVLRDYINEMAKKHYHIRKISRFYLRFKYDESLNHVYDVDGYRKHTWGHLYWRFSSQPLKQSPQKNRDQMHLWMLVGSIIGFICSLILLSMFRVQMLYADALFAFLILLPFLFISLTLDNIGRCYESFIKPKKEVKNPLFFARFRGISLGLNLLFRDIFIYLVILPALLKELKIAVVFVVLVTICYELYFTYLPHHKKNYLIVLSIVSSFIACFTLQTLKDRQPFTRYSFYYDNLETLQLEDIMDKPNVIHVTNIHRYFSNSYSIPLYYVRDEKITNLKDKNDYWYLQFKVSYCRTESLANKIFHTYLKKGYHPIENIYNVEEVIRDDDGNLLLLTSQYIYSFKSTIDLTSPEIIEKINFILYENRKAIES